MPKFDDYAILVSNTTRMSSSKKSQVDLSLRSGQVLKGPPAVTGQEVFDVLFLSPISILKQFQRKMQRNVKKIKVTHTVHLHFRIAYIVYHKYYILRHYENM